MEVSKQASKHGSVRRFYSAYCFTVDGVLVPVRESSDFQLVRSGRGLVKVPITPSGHPSSQLTQFLEFRDVPEWAGASFGQGATVPTYLRIGPSWPMLLVGSLALDSSTMQMILPKVRV